MKLLNAFSLNMIGTFPVTFNAREITLDEAKALAAKGLDSSVGHADTAAVFGDVLGCAVATNRSTVSLKSGESVLVGQYSGPRLPEGCKQLPAGATIKWLLVEIT